MPITLPPMPPPPAALDRAMCAAVTTMGQVPRRLMLADMSQPSSARRLWVLDLSDPQHPVVHAQTFVAHGSGSDPTRRGIAGRFSDVLGSGMTSLGLYKVAEPYQMAKHGKAYRLDGLSITDSQARVRGVVLHPADYVRTDGTVGRSLGCPALNPAVFASLDRQGLLAGSFLWIDGGTTTPVPTCAPPSPWPASRSTLASISWGTPPGPTC